MSVFKIFIMQCAEVIFEDESFNQEWSALQGNMTQVKKKGGGKAEN